MGSLFVFDVFKGSLGGNSRGKYFVIGEQLKKLKGPAVRMLNLRIVWGYSYKVMM